MKDSLPETVTAPGFPAAANPVMIEKKQLCSGLCELFARLTKAGARKYVESMASFINKRFRYANNNVVLWLAGVNVLFFLLKYTGITIKGVPFSYAFSLMPGYCIHGMFWQPVTYMFMHGSPSHLFWNMFMLFMFGRRIETTLGSWEFLCYYMVTGILSGLFSLAAFLISGKNVMILGASGALFAIMLMYAVLYPYDRVLVFWFIPMNVPMYVLLMASIELFYQIFGFGFGGGIAHLTHLFGFVSGWLYIVVRMRINPADVWRRAYSDRR